jgi:predicted negative regulator of RcsB-dependent stress response
MADKITKQELKQPDRLQIIFAGVMMYLAGHKKETAIVVGVLIFILLAATGWYFYRQNEEQNAWNQYNKAVAEYNKNRGMAKDTAASTKSFEEVAKKYTGTKAAAFSLYRLGNLHLDLNNIEGAIKSYQDYLKESSEDNEFRVLVYNSLGCAYEAKKEYRTALSYYEKALGSKMGLNFESTNYENVARAYEFLNDTKKALEYYKKAAEKAKEPSLKELLNRKISSLG